MTEPALFGHDLFGAEVQPAVAGVVAERFTFPPFSVLDARSGDWAARKDAWKSLGLTSEAGRDDRLTYHTDSMAAYAPGAVPHGTSIFDPVMCELAYRWWTAPGYRVLDPFAGGSVRGIVASLLGRAYVGVDLREEQVRANYNQARAVCAGTDEPPSWLMGDSMDLGEGTLNTGPVDFVFSCPPYHDLEQYSDDPRDLSNMEYGDFRACYREIVRRSVSALRPDRFAAFVVGEIRNPKTGVYRNFVGDTVKAFTDAGAAYYTEAVLLSPVGTGQLRVTRQFNGGRKLVKLHQTLLVFVKGDWKRATLALGAGSSAEGDL